MADDGAQSERGLDARRLVAWVLLLPGIGLAGVGGYFHLSLGAHLRAGACDGCDPWHPLFVVGPLVVGAALVIVAAALLSRD